MLNEPARDPRTPAAPPPAAAWQWRLHDNNPNEWEWTPRGSRRHDLSGWLPVAVPTSVQEALWRAGRLRHPYRDLQSRAAEWVEHRDWIFGVEFPLAPPPLGRRQFLEFDSIDDSCLIFLNGTRAAEHEGPAAPFAVEIGPLLREPDNQLLIVVRAPYPADPQIGWTDRTYSLKGRCFYGWDFAPRLVRVGILGPVRLRATGAHRLTDLWARATLLTGLDQAEVACAVGVDGPPGARVRFVVRRAARVVAEAEAGAGADGVARASIELPHPDLWWLNGLGGQPLYTLEATCLDGSDRRAAIFGVRDIRWAGRPDGPPAEWPLTLVVNGRRVFQRGWNWVPADALGGPRADRHARRTLRLVRQAGANCLRTNGGYDPETEAFYTACDRLGILVWQELPLSSSGINNTPPSDPAYIERAAAYAQAVIAARRNHPSLALWGGGNELTWPDGTPITADHPYIARMRAVVTAHDPDRAFRPSSPLGPAFDADPEKPDLWDVHGPWDFSQRWPGPQYWRLNGVRPLLHSELGAPGEASLTTQRRFLSPAHRSRQPDSPARRHHGGAWWEHQAIILGAFGPIEDATLAVLASQWLQAEALRYYIEETRRRWPPTAGIYLWQVNEPWPNVVCTSAVEYGGRPKLAYFAVQRAYAPTVVAARFDGFRIAPGAPLRLAVWALNDAASFAGELVVGVQDLAGRALLPAIRRAVQVPGAASAAVADVERPLPPDFRGVAVVDLALGAHHNRYLFSNLPDPPLRDALQAPQVLAGMFVPRGGRMAPAGRADRDDQG